MSPLGSVVWNGIGWLLDTQFQLMGFSSVTQSCLTLRDRVDYITPGLPIHHQLLELTQTHVH